MSEYTCADCGETFNAGWTDEEASVEFDQNFKGESIKYAAIVCDVCYQKYAPKEIN